MKILKLENVSKFYKSAETVSVGMKDINVSFDMGEFVAITGESGGGKSTLLNVISGLDGYEEGEVYHYGEETSHYTIADWENYRSAYVGFVFQNYNIIDSYTVYQNVMFALEVQGYPKENRKKRALELIEKVGLSSHKNHKASKLSGGQKQRTVIARALAKDCPIIVADEPTGNLDSESSKQIMALLHEVSKDKLVIVVTHDYSQVEEYATRKIRMHDGFIVEDKKIKDYEAVTEKIKPETNKISFATLINMSLRNIFSMPKRTIFMLLLQMVVIGVFTVVYSNQMKSINELSSSYSSIFPNVPETRLLIEKRDGSEFSSEEISRFNNNRHVLDTYENHTLFFNETQLTMINLDEEFSWRPYYISKTDSSIVLNKNDVKGNLPVEKDEIVVSTYYGDSIKIGDKVRLSHSTKGDEDSIVGDFKVVGIDLLARNTLYFSEKYLKQDIDQLPPINYTIYNEIVQMIDFNSFMLIDKNNHLIISVFPPGVIDASYEMLPPNFDPNNYELKDVTLFVMPSNVVAFEKTYEGIKFAVTDDLDHIRGVYLSAHILRDFKEAALEFYEDSYTLPKRNLLTLSIDGRYQGNQIIKTIDNDTYRVYYPANIQGPETQLVKFIVTLTAIVILFLFGLFLYTIVHAVSRNLMTSRKKDFAIYRSIGTNQKAIAKMVVIEQVILNIVGFLLIIILLNVLKYNFRFISKSINYMSIKDYLVLALSFVFFGIWIGLRFNKRVFNQSVIQLLTLSEEDY